MKNILREIEVPTRQATFFRKEAEKIDWKGRRFENQMVSRKKY